MRLSYETVTTSLGPGIRYVIWVQGCHKRCKGCINPEGWDLTGGYEKSLDDILKDILSSDNLTGITVSGGEPFLQIDELGKLISLIKSKTKLDVMIFSGYKIEELLDMYGERAENIFINTDIFIDGEYIETLNNNSMYRGSDNQRIIFFTDKYKQYKNDILNSKKREFSFKISNSGDVYFVGIPPVGFYEDFMDKLGG